jgi:transposase
MASMPATNPIDIIGGVDAHQNLHTAAVVDASGAVLEAKAFSTTRAGYRAMLA